MARHSDVGSGPFEPWPAGVDVHVEWGATGARLAAEHGDLVVVVDVLSFSTAVTLAASRGATTFSYSTDEVEQAGGREALCKALDAEIVAQDRGATDARFSLSPASLGAIGPDDRLIFTSLNGAACTSAAAAAPRVLIGALTNRSASASLVARLLAEGVAARCTVVAAGEHWSSVTDDASGIRPCVEDWIGAGALAWALRAAGLRCSAEARSAADSFEAAEHRLAATLEGCISGRELAAQGFIDDVVLAGSLDSLDVVAVWDTEEPVRRFDPVGAP